jgi:hypothetical protein
LGLLKTALFRDIGSDTDARIDLETLPTVQEAEIRLYPAETESARIVRIDIAA